MKRLLMLAMVSMFATGLFAASDESAVFLSSFEAKFWNDVKVESETVRAFVVLPSYIFSTNWPSTSNTVTATVVEYLSLGGHKYYDYTTNNTFGVYPLSKPGYFKINSADLFSSTMLTLGKVGYDETHHVVTSGSLDGVFEEYTGDAYGKVSIEFNSSLSKETATANALTVVTNYLQKAGYHLAED